MNKKALMPWFLAAFVITAAAFISYATMQQALRQAANWPQVQMAEDGAAALASGQKAESLISGTTINLETSLAPFLIIIDAKGKSTASSAMLGGSAPKIPAGVLEYTTKNSQDRVTWMPNKSIRIAAVAVKIEGGTGFVLAGRSLKETERSIDSIGTLILTMWAACIVLLAVLCVIYNLAVKKRSDSGR